jgi:hypothetical protein
VSKSCHNCRHWSNQGPQDTKTPEGWGNCAKIPPQSTRAHNTIWIFPPPSFVMTSEHFCCSLHERQMQVVTRHDG